MTTYLPVPAHLAYVAWTRVMQEQLTQLADRSRRDLIEAVEQVAALASAEPVTALIVETTHPQHPADEVVRVRLMTFAQAHGRGPLMPGVHGTGHARSMVLVVGPSVERARVDLFERVASLLRPEGPAPMTVTTLPT